MQSERERTLAIQTRGWPTQSMGTKFTDLTGIINFVKLNPSFTGMLLLGFHMKVGSTSL